MEATSTACDISTLRDVAQALEDLGFEAALDQDFAAVKVPAPSGKTFHAIFTIDELRNRLAITCEVAKYKEIAEDQLLTFLAAQSDANTRIAPFAFATISSFDDPARASAEEWIFVIIETLPLGDLSRSDLASVTEDLMAAMPEVEKVLSLVQ